MADTRARIAAGPRHSSSTARVLHACTIGAPKPLGRDDTGRLAPGAKADLVVCDLTDPNLLPMNDPSRNLIFSFGGRSVRDGWVDGRQVVSAGRVTTIDDAPAARDLQVAQGRTGRSIPDLDRHTPLALRIAAP